MIVLGLLSALSTAGTPQVDRPSVLPPLESLADRRAGSGPDASCALAGVTPGKPVPAKVWKKARGMTQVRIVHRGDQVTMDFIPGRRNIHVDDEGNVTHITCG